MHKKKIRDTVYYYTSVRENGRVKTIYLGRTEKEAKEKEKWIKNQGSFNLIKSKLFISVFIVIFIVASLFLFRGIIVGYIIVGGPEAYPPGEKLTGTININFSSEELYPKGSIMEVSIGEQKSQMELAQLLSEAGEGMEFGLGEYYVSEADLSGYGEGFGVQGEKTIYPEINFSSNITCYRALENETAQESLLMEGACSFENPYVKEIQENLTNCNVSIVNGSVYLGNETVNESFVRAAIENNSIVVTTAYAETIQGLGKGFASAQERYFSVELESFNLTAPEEIGEHVLKIRIVYNEATLKETQKNITVSLPLLPVVEKIPEVNVTLPEIRDADEDGDPDETDCDPKNPEIHHGAEEICNGVDDNCNGAADESFDFDGDGYVTCGELLDCDDSDPEVNPGMKEICDDGKDNDCDEAKDKDDPDCLCEDNDKDGYDTCHQPVDCNDNDAETNPKAKEICGNNIDENCDGFDQTCKKLKDVLESREIKFVGKEVEDEISAGKRVRIIIRLKDVSKKTDIKKIVPFKEFRNIISANVDEKELVNLINRFAEGDAESIQIDHPFSLALDEVVPKVRANLAWDSGVRGKGQTVCVIDTGIDYNHVNLSKNYLGGYDFVNDDDDPFDDHDHGTYVSGIVSGIAPDVGIIAVKSFGSDGIGYESDIVAGLDYCVRNRETYNISVILMAFGAGEYSECYCDSNLVANESNFAVSQGILAVAASGNDGKSYLKAPACGSKVTSVGATDDDDGIASFSNLDSMLDMLAPGVDVTSAKLGGGSETRSGTSASAAVVAGAASLVLEKENLSPEETEYRLRSTGEIINPDIARIDAYNAIINNVTNIPDIKTGIQCEAKGEEEYEILVWANDSFDRCKNITIKNAGASTLTNFPAYVNLTYDSDMQSNFIDIRFYGSSCNNGGNLLDYEIENYTSSSRAHVWVRVPSLPSAGTNISVYYKNNTAVGSGQNPTGVWDSYYKAVWHMAQVNATDSTSNGNNGNQTGGVTLNSSGKIDGADDFDGDNDYINCGSDDSLDNIWDSGGTISFWAYLDTPGGVSWFWVWFKGFNIYVPGDTSEIAFYQWFTLNDGEWHAPSFAPDAWKYVAITYDNSVDTNDPNIYVNGVLQTESETSTPDGTRIGDWDSTAMIGSNTDNTILWKGKIDEVRISIDMMRSASWINMSYLMANNQSQYVTVGNEATYSVEDGGSGTTCDASNPCLYIKNSTGSVKARFDDNGNIDVKGNYSYLQSSLSPPASSLKITNSTGQVVLYIDSTGNLTTRGTFNHQTSPNPSGNNDFIIKDLAGIVAGFIDGATGNMYFKGVLHYNSNF